MSWLRYSSVISRELVVACGEVREMEVMQGSVSFGGRRSVRL